MTFEICRAVCPQELLPVGRADIRPDLPGGASPDQGRTLRPAILVTLSWPTTTLGEIILVGGRAASGRPAPRRSWPPRRAGRWRRAGPRPTTSGNTRTGGRHRRCRA